MGTKKDISFKSYYDIEGSGLEYLSNNKNLTKIRSKNLRDFLLFYEKSLLSVYVEASEEKQSVPQNELHQYKGAEYFLFESKHKEILEKLSPNLLERVDFGKISQRTVYDYMNAMKYIRAVGKAYTELGNAMKEMMMNAILDEHKEEKHTKNRVNA